MSLIKSHAVKTCGEIGDRLSFTIKLGTGWSDRSDSVSNHEMIIDFVKFKLLAFQ